MMPSRWASGPVHPFPLWLGDLDTDFADSICLCWEDVDKE
jgi:hypothetical protein